MALTVKATSGCNFTMCLNAIDHKGVWITALVVSILTVLTGSLILVQQYGALGHTFSFFDSVHIGVTATLFAVGGLSASIPLIKLVRGCSPKKQNNLINGVAITETPLAIVDSSVYLGANLERIPSLKGDIVLPRTLYHLLFVYLALKDKNDSSIYPMLDCSFPMKPEQLEIYPDVALKFAETTEQFHKEAADLLYDIGYSSSTTWGTLKEVIEDICLEFKEILDSRQGMDRKQQENLWYHFYKFCFLPDPKKFTNAVLKSVALEWNAPAGTEILYRSAHLSSDHIVREEGAQHSLSFSTSIFSGLVFEGSASGACALTYYCHYHDNELYALTMTPSQVTKYFFYPKIFKDHGLLSLFGVGEFSHPRLKIFASTKKEEISGVYLEHNRQAAKEIAYFSANPKIPTQHAYQEKVHKIYNKSLCVLAKAH